MPGDNIVNNVEGKHAQANLKDMPTAYAILALLILTIIIAIAMASRGQPRSGSSGALMPACRRGKLSHASESRSCKYTMHDMLELF